MGIHGPERGALGPPSAGTFIVELTVVTSDRGAVAVALCGKEAGEP